MPTLYRQIFKKALSITFHNPWLWFFGLFLSLVVNGGVAEIIYKGLSLAPQNQLANLNDFAILNQISNLLTYIVTYQQPGFPNILLSVLVLIGVLFLLRTLVVSLGAMTYAIQKLDKDEDVSLEESYHEGGKNFYSLAAILLSASVSLLVALKFMHLILNQNTTNNQPAAIVYLILFILLLVITALVYYVAEYATAFTIIKNLPFTEAIKQGYKLTIRYWLINIELTVILFVVTLFVGLVGFFLTVFIIGMPIAYLIDLSTQFGLIQSNQFAVSIDWLIIYLITLLSWSILATWQSACWILLFQQLANKTTWRSKIERMVTTVKELHYSK